jgi:hypothetical protein
MPLCLTLSVTYTDLKQGLKIHVSVVQFHPWPPFKSIFQIKKLHQSAWTLCLILAPVSNISVRCSLDQYGSRGGLESSCYGRSPRRILSARSTIVWGTTDIGEGLRHVPERKKKLSGSSPD